MGRRIASRIVRSAITKAGAHNVFRLSPLYAIQPGEYIPDTLEAVTRVLGQIGVSGSILQQQQDLGNGRQDYGLPRVVISERGGTPVSMSKKDFGSYVVLRHFEAAHDAEA